MKIEGRFNGASEVIEVGANKTRKRTFRLDITGNSQYENLAEFSLIGDRVGITDGLKNGEHIEVDFNLNGRRWRKDQQSEEKVFMDLQCMGITQIRKEKVQITQGVTLPPKNTTETAGQPSGSDDSLPDWLKD